MNPFDFEVNAKNLMDLGRESSFAVALARATSEGLQAAVESAGWKFLQAGDRIAEITHNETLLVIGVVTWDGVEIAALRKLASAYQDEPIAVFDLDRMNTQDVLSSMLPGLPLVTQSPIVALYRRGVLEHSTEGREAIRLIEEHAVR